MSDNFTIKELLDYDEKAFKQFSGITLEATVKEVRQAYERTVKEGERKGQKFWSQKLVIDDGTGSIVVDHIAGSSEDTIPKTVVGRRVKVEDAKTDIYKGERRLARGKIMPLDSKKPPQGGSDVPSSREDEREYWDHRKDKEQRIITKSALAKSLIESGRKWNKTTQKEADSWFDWVMDGVEVKEEVQEPKSEDPNEISQVEVPDESPERAALRKTFQGLRTKLAQTGYWNDKDEVGGEAVENDYRNWLDKKFEVPSSTYLTDEEMEKGIKIMAGWLNKTIAKKKEVEDASN